MRLRLFLCLAFILALATTLPPPAQAAEDQDYFSVGDKGTLAAYLDRLKAALRAKDGATLKTLIAPGLGGKVTAIQDDILAAGLADWEPVGDRGVMLRDGEAWISGICDNADCTKMHLSLIAINLSAAQPQPNSAKPSFAKPSFAKPSFAKPSFDCAKASSPQEHMICADATLAEADAALAKAYKQAVDRTPDATALKAEQRRWVKDVRDHCQDGKCLREAYQTRLRDLQ